MFRKTLTSTRLGNISQPYDSHQDSGLQLSILISARVRIVSVAQDIDTMTKPKTMRSVQEKAPRIFKPLEESLKEEYIASTSKARCPSCKSDSCKYAFCDLACDN